MCRRAFHEVRTWRLHESLITYIKLRLFCHVLPDFAFFRQSWHMDGRIMGALRLTSSLCQAETHSNWASRKLESSKMATPRLTVLRISVITGENKCNNGDPRSTGKNAHSVAGFWGILSFCMLRECLSKTFDLAFPDAEQQDAVHLCPFYFLLTLSGFMWFAPFACLWIFVDTSGCLRNQTDQTCWHHCRWNSEMSLAVMVPKRSWWKWWISWKTPPGLRLS